MTLFEVNKTARSKEQNEPLPELKLLLEYGPKVLDEIQSGEDYPPMESPELALASCDPESLGWVPLWFPMNLPDGGPRLDEEQRLNWFKKALENYLPLEYHPKGSESSRAQAIAISLIRILSAVERWELPTPDKM